MLLIVGTVQLPPDGLDQARPFMARMIECSRVEDGCLLYSYAEDVLDAGLIHVKEMWRDDLALQRHFASAHIREWRAAWPELSIGDRRLSVYEVGAGREV